MTGSPHWITAFKGMIFLVMLFSLQLTNAQQSRRFVAEWEPAWGTLIRWPLGIPQDLVVELAKDDSLYVLVASYYQRDQAINTFSAWGVNLNHCRFLFAPTYSHWTRDWGPHYVFNESGVAGIADPVFNGYPWVPGCNIKSGSQVPEGSLRSGNKGWEEDDAVNIILADSFNCPLIPLPIYLTGGNVMVDGYHTAIATRQMLDENYPGFTEAQFRQIAEDSLGIFNFIIVENPEINGIQHIDCYAKFLNETTILVKEVDPWNPEYQCCEDLAEHLENEVNCHGEPYTIIRIYCGAYSGNNVAAYTNSLILNKKVLVPLFGINSDTDALQTYQQAMPGYEVIGFQWSAWYHYDALHCRTMGIFDRFMLRMEHKPLSGDVIFPGYPKFEVMIDDRSEAGLITDELKVYWRNEGSNLWNEELLSPGLGIKAFQAYLTSVTVGESYEYYIAAADYSARHETLPRSAPAGFYSFTYAGMFTAVDPSDLPERLTVNPSVFGNETTISFSLQGSQARISIWTLAGKKVKEWLIDGSSSKSILWEGRDQKGSLLPNGMYLISLETERGAETKKCVISR